MKKEEVKKGILYLLQGTSPTGDGMGYTFLEIKEFLELNDVKGYFENKTENWERLKILLSEMERKGLIEERHFEEILSGRVDYSIETLGIELISKKQNELKERWKISSLRPDLDKGVIKRLVNLYIEKSVLEERKYVFEKNNNSDANYIKERIEVVKKEISLMIPKVKEYMDNSVEFIKIIKELINENPQDFQIGFSQPPLDDFLNIMIHDVKIRDIVDKKTLSEWRKKLSKEGIEVNF